MCDIPSPIDDVDGDHTIPFTTETGNTFSVCSLSYSMTPLHSSTIYEKDMETNSVTLGNATIEENAPTKLQALTTMVSKAFYPSRWKGMDGGHGSKDNKPSILQMGKSAQKRNPSFDITTECPVSSKHEKTNQGQEPPLHLVDTGPRLGKSRLPLLRKHTDHVPNEEDSHVEVKKSITSDANNGRSSMDWEPTKKETQLKDDKNKVLELKEPTGGIGCKIPTLRYSYGRTDRTFPNSSEVLSETNLLPSKSPMAIGQPEVGVPENAAVTVAIRVRPLNEREISNGYKSVVSVTGQTVHINYSQSNQKNFHYDFCFSVSRPGDDSHCSQEEIYKQLARPLLGWVFQGYNTCLFAYGQTGSGKSYTMMGYNADIGIIPRFCQELFQNINHIGQKKVNYHVEMSYFEIYNEKIHDLLTSPRDMGCKIALKVREHPIYGPYVDGLSTYVVASFTDVQTWLEFGNKQRATAATGMNDKSSRSHSVFVLSVIQTMTELLEGEIHDHTRTSRVNLVDLAGSERCSSAQTTGIRLKEGASINKSLLTLGKVISALAEMANINRRSFIPYRESLLTWLLKDSLGGNSKTAMIATISPTSVNMEESLSTLRYASQARNIINVARVNEDSNAALIRELKSEIAKLKAAQQCVQGVDQAVYESSLQEICCLRERLLSQERELMETQKSWEEKLNLAQQQKIEESKELQRAGICLKVDTRFPNLVNLNEDPQLSEVLLYLIKEGRTKVGKQQPGSDQEIQLTGALIAVDHCFIVNECGKVTLTSMPGAKTFVKGNLVKESVVLHHGDSVIFGGNHYFRFNNPKEVQSNRRTLPLAGAGQEKLKDFEFAKNELIDAQRQRIENEIEGARIQAQTEMMQELQAAKALAQMELIEQKKLYEDQIKQLERKREEEQVKRISLKRSQKDKTTSNREHLPPLSSSSQTCEMGINHSKLIQVLELEKDNLARQVEKIQQRGKRSISAEKQEQWTALQLSITLQEANTISKSLNRQTVFSRYDPPTLNGEEKAVYIKVSNTNLGISTMWNLEKFEEKLACMRELYQGCFDTSGDELFYDPTDTWEVESKQPSPKRGRNSLSRQTSGLLVGKAPTDTFVTSSTFSSVCKQLVTSEVELLGKEECSQGLILQLLTDLHEISTSSNVLQTYEQQELGDVNIQDHLIRVYSAFSHMAISVRMLNSFLSAPEAQASYLKQQLVAEVKKLGGGVAFLLHGCESDITSMLKKSKKQINQSVTVIAGLVGQVSIARQLNFNQTLEEKCGLEQAEFIAPNIKGSFLRETEDSLIAQTDVLLGEVQSLEGLYQKAWLESHRLAEDVRKCLLPLGQSLQCYLNKCREFWLDWNHQYCAYMLQRNSSDERLLYTFCDTPFQMQFQSIKGQTANYTQDLSLHDCYKRIACHLDSIVMGWKDITVKSVQYMTDGTMDGAMKQDVESFFKSASLSAKAFSSLCNETADHHHTFDLSPVTKEIEAAVPEMHTNARDLLRLIKVLGDVNCLNSGMFLSSHNKPLPGGPRADLDIHLWGRSRDSVRVAIAKWNYEALLRETKSYEGKRTL